MAHNNFLKISLASISIDRVIKYFSAFYLGLLICQGAHTSEVVYRSVKVDLKVLVNAAPEIWIARDLKQQVSLKRVVFPVETHKYQTETHAFEQFADTFELVEALKHSHEQIKRGQKIQILIPPEFNEASVKAYHEQDQSESPIVDQYQPAFAIERDPAGDRQILFLAPAPDYPGAFMKVKGAAEGLGAKEALKKLIKPN